MEVCFKFHFCTAVIGGKHTKLYFSKLITDCLQDKEIKFTKAVSREIDNRKFVSELFRNLKFVCQETELEELFEQEHFHLVKSRYIKEKIEIQVNNPYPDYNKLCQIPLGQEPCLYGNLQKSQTY